MLEKWYYGVEPKSTDIFQYKVKNTHRNLDNLLITFQDNQWIKVSKDGWRSESYSDDTQDVISNRHFFIKNRTSESLGLGNVAYTSRPSKGVTYKNMILGNVDISRNDNRTHVSVPYLFSFNVEAFKKYKEYQFNTHNGLYFYEKVSNKNVVLKTCITINDSKNERYSMTIERCSTTRKVIIRLSKNFSSLRESIIKTNFKDCGVDNIYNKYLMFEFDLTAEQKDFEIVDKVRNLLKSFIQTTHDNLKNSDINPSVVGNILRRLEVIESDEYQVQKRP